MKIKLIKFVRSLVTLLTFAASVGTAPAQNGGSYTLAWSTLDGGGGISAGGAFSVAGTIGQPDAGTHRGGGYSLVGGFWGIDAPTDSDGDDIPDEWERFHGLNPSDPDGTRDSDGDGKSNWEEYIANTHPLDSQSYLALGIAPVSGVGPSPMISWIANPDRVYQIWMRNNLNSTWVDSGFGIIQPAAGVGPSPMRVEFGVGPSPMYKLFGVGPSPMREVLGVGPSPMRIFRIEAKLPPAGR